VIIGQETDRGLEVPDESTHRACAVGGDDGGASLEFIVYRESIESFGVAGVNASNGHLKLFEGRCSRRMAWKTHPPSLSKFLFYTLSTHVSTTLWMESFVGDHGLFL